MESHVAFHVSDVPVYLRKSAFFQTLSAEDEESITLPANVFKQDTTVTSVEEAAHLLSTLQFWGSDIIPEDLIKLFCTVSPSSIDQMLNEFDENFETIRFMREINSRDDAKRVNFILTKGKLEMVILVLEQAPAWDRKSACKHAALSGSLQCLELMHKLGGTLDAHVCAAACRGGFVDCVQYLLENGVEKKPFLARCAVETGHLDMLKFLHAEDCPWNSSTARCAAENNHLECLAYLHQHKCPFDKDVFAGAAASGHLDILKYLCEIHCPWDYCATHNAAYHGNLECLRYLHEQDCPWECTAPEYAVLRGHFDCLQYLYENHCPWHTGTTYNAAVRNNLDVLIYAHERGCPITFKVYRWAARYGNIGMMQYAHEQGVDWGTDTHVIIAEAARAGSLECLVFAHQAGCAIAADHANFAAAGGHLSCLKYILSHVNARAGEARTHNIGSMCAAASEFNHLDCLVYLRENKCMWDKRSCHGAAARGALECLKYAVEHGCIYDKARCYTAAVEGRHMLCAEYIASLPVHERASEYGLTCRDIIYVS